MLNLGFLVKTNKKFRSTEGVLSETLLLRYIVFNSAFSDRCVRPCAGEACDKMHYNITYEKGAVNLIGNVKIFSILFSELG